MLIMLTNLLLMLIIILIVLIIVIGSFHQIMLKKEEHCLIPNGKMITIRDHKIHVYGEGEVSVDKPTIVFMPGSSILAPVYSYKTLYSKLSDEYRVVVIEKYGYGYSEATKESRRIDVMLWEIRTALQRAGEKPPFVLMPYDMSGLDALYWAQTYPFEVSGIVGLNMSLPGHYVHRKINKVKVSLIQLLTRIIGIQRIASIARVYWAFNNAALTLEEELQHKYLVNQRACNQDIVNEIMEAKNNAKRIQEGVTPNKPILLFLSDVTVRNGSITIYKAFIDEIEDGRIEELKCGKVIHYYKSEEIAEKTKTFIKNLRKTRY